MDTVEQTQHFRRALGSFATGVTIVTTFDGVPAGVTASSFNSVSLDPPLVLWSLARKSGSMDAFRNAGHFAVHVLGAHQEALSGRFARGGSDKFEGVSWRPGVAGSPILDDYCALFECRTVQAYDGGDHVIFVGQVEKFDGREVAPLLFHGGRYAEARVRSGAARADETSVSDGRFTEDFLMYLLARAHFQSSAATRQLWEGLGLSQSDMLVLSTLSMTGSLPRPALINRLDHTGLAPDDAAIGTLLDRGLIVDLGEISLSESGRRMVIRILALSKAVEDELLKTLGEADTADLKRILRLVIDSSRTLSVDPANFLLGR